MADIVETVVGMAEPALKTVAGIVESVQGALQKMINTAVADALKAAGVTGGGAAALAPPASVEAPPAARVRPLRAPGR